LTQKEAERILYFKQAELEAKKRVEAKKLLKLSKQSEFMVGYPEVRQRNMAQFYESRLHDALQKRNALERQKRIEYFSNRAKWMVVRYKKEMASKQKSVLMEKRNEAEKLVRVALSFLVLKRMKQRFDRRDELVSIFDEKFVQSFGNTRNESSVSIYD
jgi:hypothetical protein